MATKVIQGKNLLIKFDGVAVGCASEVSFSSEREMIEAACKESGDYYDGTPGMISTTLSLSGIIKIDTPADPTKVRAYDIVELFQQGALVEWAFGTDEVGEKIIEGQGYLNSVELSGGTSDPGAYSNSITVVGPWTVTTNA